MFAKVTIFPYIDVESKMENKELYFAALVDSGRKYAGIGQAPVAATARRTQLLPQDMIHVACNGHTAVRG
jgi:hypothetical protein